jgi:ATP/maltotriose-dependent transcriptional regulator MalT
MNEWVHPGGAIGSSLAPEHASVLDIHEDSLHASSGPLVRDRLTDALGNARPALVLLAAPPGFGKTTLLRQWQTSDERSFAVVTLDAADNDPIVFWTRIVEALRSAEPGLKSAAQIALHAPRADLQGVVIPLLAHDLRFVENELVLALDDYQQIEERACHESIELFLRWMPPNVTLVLSTRLDPPIPIGTLRAGGDLFELRAIDLCFTEKEEADFLNETLGLRLDGHALAVLHERTEGWPAGVYLASLSLQKTEDRAEFVAGFSGSNRHVVDYLTEVVLDSLDPRRRQFLLESSILTSVCGSLADAVTGNEGSSELLEELERANLFLVALDEEREWYRYHQLFGDLLRGQLMRHQPELLQVLHARASGWYAESGETDRAIAHAVAAGDVEGAVELAARAWAPELDSAQARTSLRWLGAIGEEAVDGDARLSLVKAWAAGLTDQRDEGIRALETAKGVGLASVLSDGSSLTAAAAVVEASFPRGDAGAMLEAARRAVELEEELAPAWRALARLALGWAEYLAGNWDPAEVSLQVAVAAAAELERWLSASIAHALLAHVALAQGDHDRAEKSAREAVAALEGPERVDALASGMAEVAFGAALAGHNVGEAGGYLNRGISRLRTHGEPLLVAEALLAAAPVRRKLQGAEAARASIAEARKLLESCPDAGMLGNRLEEVARTLTPGYRRAGKETDLTERELEVLRYLAQGLPKRDIGDALFLSYNTIHSHTKSIYHKLRVSSREAAVAKARELGAL